MKQLTTAIQNRDLGALARMMPSEPQRRVVNREAEEMVDVLFTNLLQLFPAARHTVLSSPEAESAAKRQWILAFAENGITTRQQVAAGMRQARAIETDFWPSPGKFISWCKAAASAAVGLPDLDAVMREFERYNATRDQCASPEDFDWSHPALYWIVLDMRHRMYQYKQTEQETLKTAQSLLADWGRRLARGEQIPQPSPQIEDKRRPPSAAELSGNGEHYRQVGQQLLQQIKAKREGRQND